MAAFLDVAFFFSMRRAAERYRRAMERGAVLYVGMVRQCSAAMGGPARTAPLFLVLEELAVFC